VQLNPWKDQKKLTQKNQDAAHDTKIVPFALFPTTASRESITPYTHARRSFDRKKQNSDNVGEAKSKVL
jgi:hypothetical protein